MFLLPVRAFLNQSLADAACAGAVVVGPPITPIDVEDLRDVHTAIEINGKVMGTGSTKANPLGGPIQSLVSEFMLCVGKHGVVGCAATFFFFFFFFLIFFPPLD